MSPDTTTNSNEEHSANVADTRNVEQDEPNMIQIPKEFSAASVELLFWYYNLRTKVEKELNHKNNKKDYIELYNRPDFIKDCTDKFCERLGIIGWYYCVADSLKDKVHIFKNEAIDPDEQNLPFYYCPPPKQNADEDKRNKNLLLDLMYEAEEEYFKLNSKKKHYTPYFLENIPPFVSEYSGPLLPPEKRMRKNEDINFLHCYTGETLYYLYTYRYLLRIIQNQGFSDPIILDSVEIKNTKKEDFQLWDLKEWEDEGFRSIPEYRWLNVIEEGEPLTRYSKGIHFKNLKKEWQDYIDKNEKTNKGIHCHFINDEWKHMGLMSDRSTKEDENSPGQRARTSLLSYTVHLALNLPVNPHFRTRVFNHLKGDYCTLMEDTLEIIESNEDKLDRGNKFKVLIENPKNLNNKEWIHYFIILIFYLSFKAEEASQKMSAKTLLKNLQIRARFPVLQSYFQLAWAKKKTPIEHHYIPLHKSIRYAYDINLPFDTKQSKQTKSSKNTFVMMGCILLDPIWAIKGKENFHITEGKEYYLFEEDAVLSSETKLRLNLVQDFLKLMAAPAIDYFFYGKLREDQSRLTSRKEQHKFQAHEIKDLISCIDPKSPPYVLELVRLYFNVIFGSRESVISDFVLMNKDTNRFVKKLPNEFRFDLKQSTIKDIIINAIKVASNIHAISEDYAEIRQGKYYRFPDETTFRTLVDQNFVSKVEIKEEKGYWNNPLKNKWFLDKNDGRGFYFMMAIVCGLRNAFEHKDENSKIIILGQQNIPEIGRCIVIKNQMKSINENFIRKFNLGSTALSLVYYCSELLKSNNYLDRSFEKEKNNLSQSNLVVKLIDGPKKEKDDRYFYYTYIPILN